MPPVDPHKLQIRSEIARQLRSHVEFLAGPELKGRKPGTPGNQAAAHYIVTQFQEAGLAPLHSLRGYRQPISAELGDNVVGARIPNGSERDLKNHGWILIGAHYDHLGESVFGKTYRGADDNAAAVAILLHLARVLPPLANHPVLFVAFNTEEPPFIRTRQMGSQVFLDRLPSEIGASANISAAIIMDLMGGIHWEPLREIIFAAGAEKSTGLYRRFKESSDVNSLSTFSSGLSTPLSVLPLGTHLLEELPVIGHHPVSDYDAFRNASVPFVFLSAGRTPHYHQPSDLPDTLHYERMAATVRWLDHFVRLIDTDRDIYSFEPERLEIPDEWETLRTLVDQASRLESGIPNMSFFSLYRLQLDSRWLSQLIPETVMLSEKRDKLLRRLERISIRVQCLLADFYGCGFF